LRQALDGLFASPRSEESWVTAVREQITGIRGLAGADDATVAQAQQRAAEIMMARGAEAREQRRFSEAERLLGFAAGFVPQLNGLTAERQRLADDRARVQQEEAQRDAAARVERLKQTFTARANADNIGEARATLEELRGVLPASDEFLTTTAPQAMSDIYLRLARGAFDRGDFTRAEGLVAQGLAEFQAAGLRTLSEQISTARAARLEKNVAAVEAVLDRSDGDANQTKELLTAIQSDVGNDYASVQARLVEKAQARITRNPRDQAYVQFVTAVFDREFTVPQGRPCEPTSAGRGGACADNLNGGKDRGPALVVVPGASGGPLFAIGRTEVTIADWNTYCRLSTRCAPTTGSREDFDTFPVTKVTLQAVEEYAAWLTQETGVTYRLPTRAEWLHVANAPRRETAVDHNCGRPAARQAAVGRGNDWGVVNYLGNVREWVTTGGGYELRGGDFTVRMDQCIADRTESTSGQADDRTGFRLVRELPGAGG
jgi:non-specific serine/threonine protein kinase